jgi:hypothetical protein
MRGKKKETEKQIFFSPENFHYRKFLCSAMVLLPVSFAEASVILVDKKLRSVHKAELLCSFSGTFPSNGSTIVT